jgi:hypothetical protein
VDTDTLPRLAAGSLAVRLGGTMVAAAVS